MPEQYFTIEAGKIKEQTRFTKWLWEHKNGRWNFKTESKSKRSLPQNAYLHAVLFPEFMEGWKSIGYDEIDTPNKAKAVAKRLFLTRTFEKSDIEYVQDTSELTKIECAEFIEKVIKFSAENLNRVIPYPNEQTAFQYE